MSDANQALLIGLFATIVSGIIIPIVTHMLRMRQSYKVESKIDAIREQTNGIAAKLVEAKFKEGKMIGKKRAENAAKQTLKDKTEGAREERNKV